MSRLIGKKQEGGLSLSLLLVVAVGIAGVLEYSGFTNFVENFGAEENNLIFPESAQEGFQQRRF